MNAIASLLLPAATPMPSVLVETVLLGLYWNSIFSALPYSDDRLPVGVEPFCVIGLLLDSTCTSFVSDAVTVVDVVPPVTLPCAFSFAPPLNVKACPLVPPYRSPLIVTDWLTLNTAFGASTLPLNVSPLVPLTVLLPV